MKSLLKILAISSLPVLFGGCASSMCGTHQRVPVATWPGGATVTVYNEFSDVLFKGTTPCNVDLARAGQQDHTPNYHITISKPDYMTQEITLSGRVNQAFCVDLVSGGVGAVVDSATGAMWTLVPADIQLHLKEQSVPAAVAESKPAKAEEHPDAKNSVALVGAGSGTAP